jgi:RNA recognition motif-containing protein
MSVKLYVGNLPFSISDQDLEGLFAQAGQVESVSVITDRDTGRSRGFGFVEMESREAAEAAIQQLNGYEMDGRAIVVNEARPREDRGGGGLHASTQAFGEAASLFQNFIVVVERFDDRSGLLLDRLIERCDGGVQRRGLPAKGSRQGIAFGQLLLAEPESHGSSFHTCPMM